MTTEQLIKKLMEDNNRILSEQKRFNFEFWVSVAGCLVIFATIIWLKY
jgi:hypothetical protein